MKISYERDMAHNYMIPEAEFTGETQNWQIQMLTGNQISGFLHCSVRTVNCKNQYCYDITSRQSMAQIYETQVIRIGEIRTILGCLYRTLREVEKYLLDAERIVLEPECIYMDIESKETWFCYLPEYQVHMEEAIQKLTSWFLCHLDQSDSTSVLQGYEVYRKAMEQHGSIQEFLRFVMSLPDKEEDEAGQTEKNSVRMPAFICTDSAAADPRKSFREKKERTEEAIKKYENGNETRQLHHQREIVTEAAAGRGWTENMEPPTENPGNYFSEEKFGQKRRTKGLRAGIQPVWMVLLIAALAVLGIQAGFLTLTQAGEITFLAAGLTIYGVSILKKKQKEEQDGSGEQAWKREQKAERLRLRKEKRFDGRRKKNAEKMDEPYAVFTVDPEMNPVQPSKTKKEMVADEMRGSADVKPGFEDGSFSAEGKPGAEEKTWRNADPSGNAAMGVTTLLWKGEMPHNTHLTLTGMDSRDRQSIVLLNDSYMVGKLKSKADIWVNDPAVSRIHAKIQKEGEEYFLQDLNATNGTFLNGRRLEVQEKVRIREGDEIMFAGTGYYVGCS